MHAWQRTSTSQTMDQTTGLLIGLYVCSRCRTDAYLPLEPEHREIDPIAMTSCGADG
jgi:hypothetical protein